MSLLHFVRDYIPVHIHRDSDVGVTHEFLLNRNRGAVLSKEEEHETWLRKLSSLTSMEQSGTAIPGTQMCLPH
jgi:hypothetical protein